MPYFMILNKLEAIHNLQEEQMNLFTAVVQKEDALYVAQCLEVGTASQGETIEEAIKNLQEATELYLEEFPHQAGCPAVYDNI